MAKSGRKLSNELEFQGEVISWLNNEILKRKGINIDKATQEKPRLQSGKRSDLVIWKDRASETAFLAVELKTPNTLINDPVFFADAIEKAQHWHAPYFAMWNMREIEVYRTPAPGSAPLPHEAIMQSALPLSINSVEDWFNEPFTSELKIQALEMLDAALIHAANGEVAGQAIDTEIFVSRLTESIRRLRTLFYRDLRHAAASNRALRKTLSSIAAEQGFKGFVQDINYAIAGQMGYRLIGQILFYFALRRKITSLREITLSPSDKLPDALQPYWNEVRRYDYEALYKPDRLDSLVPIPSEAAAIIRQLVRQLGAYDWASLTDDVLGSIFEHLIPQEEQLLLGQFYTPRHVADLLVALTVDGTRPMVLDPGCGSGTFLMSLYGYIAHTTGLSHKELLSTIWGFDISPFAAELAVINLYRQNMSEYENFPRIVTGDFFSRNPGDTVPFPPPRITAGATKIDIPIPYFDCILGNPPYLRSQNQDDLDSGYRSRLFAAAARAGIQAPAKTDLFAFFIYHAMRFMQPGSRLGFVTPASWLTADYAYSLQEAFLGEIKLVTVVSSHAESFFPQVDINAVLLVAEKVASLEKNEPIRFVTLKQPIEKLTQGSGLYWDKVIKLADEIEASEISIETDMYRIKIIESGPERAAIKANRKSARNWSKFMRAPLSYYEIFERNA
ncbi:N-6 DNA methylase [Brucella sp. BO3]|uniref:restriction endonuclease subunit M n=1 Tax=unclassified Brucella TaxID=2632610 RepID=UPI00084FAA58|nr:MULTISPECIES: N-6 DNA methylase [unclassified Brucella]OEI84746.1 hypothetical protein BA060_01510 [Brucella sp. B13-0095]QMV26912.1 N-6 DNA methylase [Brucella sp. BO3]